MIAGQVADYSGPAGVLEAEDGYGDSISLGTGSIDSDGNFSVRLNDTVSESDLEDLQLTECDGLNVSDPDVAVKSLPVPELFVVAEGEVVGALVPSSVDPNMNPDSYTTTVRIYVNRDVTIRGTCEIADVDTVEIDTFNLSLKRGWNVVSAELEVDRANSIYKANYWNGTASGVRWYYYDYQ